MCPPDVVRPTATLVVVVITVVVDGEFIATGIGLGMFVDGRVAIHMGVGLSMTGVGFDMVIMPELAEVMDSKCRPSSISTESVEIRLALRALGLLRSFS